MRSIYLFATTFYISTVLVFAQGSQSLGDVARAARASKAVTESSGQTEAEKYLDHVQELLQERQFDQLDQLAAAERSSKARFPGGGWKLRTLYIGLAEFPAGVKATDQEWTSRTETLKLWIQQKPNSITPRVALAEAYIAYAWQARGNGYADKVTENGWKSFDEGIKLAKTTLEEAASLKEKCPQWFNAMQSVALAQGWSKVQASKLLEQAIAFEPSYYYYYNQFANYLLPKWYGEEGETEQFADAISSRIGGKEGSIIYFEIAARIGCHCSNEDLLPKMSWEKMQQGYAALEKEYGTSSHTLNLFAYMAVKMMDAQVAQQTFAQIGDNWEKETWRSRSYFEQSKAWASQAVKSSEQVKAAALVVEANLQTPEGQKYDREIAKEFSEKFVSAMQQCVERAGNDLGSFDLFVRVGASGGVQQVLSSRPTAVSHCLFPSVYAATFTPPPTPEYWIKIGMNIAP